MQDQDNFLHGKSKFSESEKLYLASLVEQVSDIIECTKTDGASTMAKENAWRMITEEYANGYKYGIKVPRSKEQLKRCWYNLKYRCRKADSAEKQHRLKTGGGKPLSPNPEEEINNKVRAIVPTINFTPENPWDSTSQLENSFDSTNYECEFSDENLFDEDLDIECSDSNDFNLSLNNKIQCGSADVSSKKDSVINTVGKILKK